MLPHIDIHTLNTLIYTTMSARVSFHAITVTYIHLHILPHMNVHILYILIYAENINICSFYTITITYIHLCVNNPTGFFLPDPLSYALIPETHVLVYLSLLLYILFWTVTFVSQVQIIQMRCRWKANSRIFHSHLNCINQFSCLPCQNYA